MYYSPAPSPGAMHIPDGFLSVLVSVVLWIVSILVVAYALKRVSSDLGERQVPLMGVLAAAIFAGQMLNFAVAGGTSGHLMGAAIATILLGPWAAVLVMTTVVSVQALIFQDGGLLALGANIFNMAVVGVAVSYLAYTAILKITGAKKSGIMGAGFAAAWLSIVVVSLGVALQLALSGTSPANIAVPAMAGIHAIIGVGEGLITVGALALVFASRPDLLISGQAEVKGGRIVWVAGLLLALSLVILSPLASSRPDGLEWVAQQRGFLDQAQGPIFNVIPDYLLPGMSNETLATILAGVVGVLIVLGVMFGATYLRRSRRETGD